MSFGSIDVVTMGRAQDYTTIKQNEDNKGMVEQSNLGQYAHKQVEQNAQSVTDSQNADWHNKRQDAKDKGNNQYEGDGGRDRKNPKKDRVVLKGHQGFDIKI